MRRLHLLLLIAFILPLVCFGQDDYTKDTVVENSFYPPPPEDEVQPSTVVNEIPFDQIEGPVAVEVKTLPPQTVERLKEDDDYWYADYVPQKPKAPKQKQYKPPPSIGLGWLRPLFWIVLIGGLIAGIIWFLAHNDVRLFAKASKKISVEDEEEELTDDIFAINYEKEIRKAEEAGNYRLAVRLWYLRTLRELADRSLINYKYGKTNSDYVSALFGGNYYRPFFGLTRTFDYTWYGQFPLSAETYNQVAADFTAFKNGLGS